MEKHLVQCNPKNYNWANHYKYRFSFNSVKSHDLAYIYIGDLK